MAQLQILIWIMGLVVLLTLQKMEPSAVCNPAEYRIGAECCPMCSPGNYVRKHCTDISSTSCVPCFGSTYLDEPNGLTACIPCRNCDRGFGLKVKQPCRPTSDTVCEPLEEFYCTDPTKDGCKAAQSHSICKPGQYISQKGTTFTDTECVDCTGDSFSNGSFTSCKPHTKCDSVMHQVKPGTHWTDTECEPQNIPLVAVIGLAVAVLAFVIGVTIGVTTFLIIRKTSASELGNVNTEMHIDSQPPTEEPNPEVITLMNIRNDSIQDF